MTVSTNKFFSFFIIISLYGCGATYNKPIESEVLSFDGFSGVIRVDAPKSAYMDFPAFEANKYCLKLESGYGVKSISPISQNSYSFSCKIMSLEAAKSSPAQSMGIDGIVKEQKSAKSLCSEFGFPDGSLDLSKCVLQIELAKKQSAENEERFRVEQEAYQRKIAEIEREKERRRGAAFLELGARMMGGQRPIEALSSLGTGAPIAPTRPSNINQTIRLPNGQIINCSTMGAMTNCF